MTATGCSVHSHGSAGKKGVHRCAVLYWQTKKPLRQTKAFEKVSYEQLSLKRFQCRVDGDLYGFGDLVAHNRCHLDAVVGNVHVKH